MMPQRLLKIRNFNKPPDSRDQTESDAIYNIVILNLWNCSNFLDKENSLVTNQESLVNKNDILYVTQPNAEEFYCSKLVLTNQESLVNKNDILYVTQPNTEESVATHSNCTDILSVTQSNAEKPRVTTFYYTDILPVTQSNTEEPLATNSNSTDYVGEPDEVTNKENSDKNNVTKPNVEEPLATNSYYLDNVVESAEGTEIIITKVYKEVKYNARPRNNLHSALANDCGDHYAPVHLFICIFSMQ
ncbi:unnamed protein product [Parnassius apollo]|uniref:(apollo) hypothetical protein n=1 Tax=Parnassius apollo TaxID=110799 RepID=A0A8S3WY96_PARAO|nr:unnamed protein product [Parnassius apollo]